MGWPLTGSLTSLVPIPDCQCVETCLSVMMCQQFGLCLNRLWKLGFQDLGNPLVILLPSAFQQGLIRCILDQGMLKHIRRLWWETALVHQFCLDQPVQLM